MGADGPPRLVFYGDERLRRKCRDVVPGDPGLPELVAGMARLMGRHHGVGLAAPQVGDDRRVVLVAPPDRDWTEPLALVNPVLAAVSDATGLFEEGCLSFPGIYRLVRRPRAATVRYVDLDGVAREFTDDGLLARIALHEIDHLDGVLFVDHLSPWTRAGVDLRMKLRSWGGMQP